MANLNKIYKLVSDSNPSVYQLLRFYIFLLTKHEIQ